MPSVRSSSVLALAIAALLPGVAASAASADVLRLDQRYEASTDVPRATPTAATVIAPDGSRRALPPPVRSDTGGIDPADLLASPDGRYVALRGSREDIRQTTVDRSLSLVPTDGGPTRVLSVGGATWMKLPVDPIWSADGRELVLTAVTPVESYAGRHRRLGPTSTFRCVPETGVCRRVTGTGRRVGAPLPDGRLVAADATWAGRSTRTPCGWRVADMEDTTGNGYRAGSRCDRFLTGFLRKPIRLDARLFPAPGAAGPSSRLLPWSGDLRRGVPHATAAVASASGVLIRRARVRVHRSDAQAQGPGVASESSRTSALLVSPRGRARTVSAPYLTTVGGRRSSVAPMYALPRGGWLGSVGGDNGGRQAQTLTVTRPGGSTRAVAIRGAAATPFAVARAARVRLAKDDVEMSLAGYERATNSAIVVVSPLPRAVALAVRAPTPGPVGDDDPSSVPDAPPPGALVRVPLDGRTPPAIVEAVPDPDAATYAAW